MDDAWPIELRVSNDRRQLLVTWNNGDSFELTAELLRTMSPSAELRKQKLEYNVIASDKCSVSILSMTLIGNYAVRISFDDCHDTGIFTWQYLRELSDNESDLLARYEDRLTYKKSVS